MAFDASLVERLRDALSGASVSEKRMFGGVAFLWRGHMLVGVVEDRLVARVGPAGAADALAQPHVRPMDFTGRPMAGWVYVEPPALVDDAALESWIGRARAFVATLPPK